MKDDKMREAVDFTEDFPKFNKNMKGTHKILIPDMLPVHFGIIVEILRARRLGYRTIAQRHPRRHRRGAQARA